MLTWVKSSNHKPRPRSGFFFAPRFFGLGVFLCPMVSAMGLFAFRSLTLLGFADFAFGLRVCGHDSDQSGGTTCANNVRFSPCLFGLPMLAQ